MLQPGIAPIQAGHQTLEVNLVKEASTRDTISKIGYGTNTEPMESRVPKVTVTAKEIYLPGPNLERPEPSRRL